MAEQTISTNLQTIRFRTDFAKEYVRKNRFSPYSGKGVNNVICQKLDSFHIGFRLAPMLNAAGL